MQVYVIGKWWPKHTHTHGNRSSTPVDIERAATEEKKSSEDDDGKNNGENKRPMITLTKQHDARMDKGDGGKRRMSKRHFHVWTRNEEKMQRKIRSSCEYVCVWWTIDYGTIWIWLLSFASWWHRRRRRRHRPFSFVVGVKIISPSTSCPRLVESREKNLPHT